MVILKNSGHKFVINMLTDIVAAICEHEKKLDLILVANYMDHYRAHLMLTAEVQRLGNNETDFYEFITDQSLLDSATNYIAAEANETVAPLKAL